MLSKDAQTMLHELYRVYKVRRQNHLPKVDCKDFKSAKFVKENFFSDWLLEDVEEAMRELGRNEYLNIMCVDDTVLHSEFTDYAISIMENQEK